MANDIAAAQSGLSPVVEIKSGKLRGANRGRHLFLQGRALWRIDCRAQPVYAAASGAALEWGARCPRLFRSGVAIARTPGATRGARNSAWAARHDARNRRLPKRQSVDSGARRWRQAAGHGVAAWRRFCLWLGQPRGDRRRQSGAARRCRCRQRQSSPEHPRIFASRRHRRRPMDAFEQCRHARHRRRASLGARQHCGVWRRSRQRHDLRRVGWRRQSQRLVGDARRARVCSTARSSKAERRSASRPASARMRWPKRCSTNLVCAPASASDCRACPSSKS